MTMQQEYMGPLPASNSSSWSETARFYERERKAGDLPKPELSRVLALYNERRLYFSAFRTQCEEEETFFRNERDVPVPEEMRVNPVKPGTANSLINVAAAHVDVNNLAIDVPPPSQRGRARAEKVQKFLEGAWMQVSGKVKRTAVKHGFTYGTAFLKVMWDSDRWPDAPLYDDFDDDEKFREAMSEFLDRRNISYPIVVQNVNPRHLLWDDARTGMKWAIEYHQLSNEETSSLYPQYVGDRNGVTYMEYWDTEWFGIIVSGNWHWGPKRHSYGFLPYVQIMPAFGLDHDVDRPERRYWGMLRPVHNLIEAEARHLTQMEAMVAQHSFRGLDFKGPNAGQVEQYAERYDSSPAAKNPLPSNMTVEPSPAVEVPQSLGVQHENVRNAIEEATFPNVVRGVRPSGVSSGFHTSLLAGMGRLVFGAMADAMAEGMAHCSIRFLKLVENKARGRMTVRARSEVHRFDQTISPSDIRGMYEVIVRLKAEAPEEREREAQLALRLRAAGIISLTEAMRRSGITNPLEEQALIAMEQILEMLRPYQVEEAALALNLGSQMLAAAGTPAPSGDVGNRFLPGSAQLPRLGEANIQRQRLGQRAANEGDPSVYPRNNGDVGLLGSLVGAAPGGALNLPSGQTVR